MLTRRSPWRRLAPALAAGFLIAMEQTTMSAEASREGTLEEIKEESIARAERGGYPLIGLDPVHVREAFQSIRTPDRDEWAAAWITLGDRYHAKAQAAVATDAVEARANYLCAWRLYSFGRWPAPSSPGKQRAYAKALEAFLAAAKGLNPPLEVVRIPFEGSEIVAYMGLPGASRLVPSFSRSAVSTAARKTSSILSARSSPTASA
jgi:esterase FrsA